MIILLACGFQQRSLGLVRLGIIFRYEFGFSHLCFHIISMIFSVYRNCDYLKDFYTIFLYSWNWYYTLEKRKKIFKMKKSLSNFKIILFLPTHANAIHMFFLWIFSGLLLPRWHISWGRDITFTSSVILLFIIFVRFLW